MRLLMGQTLPHPRFGKAHDVFEFKIMIKRCLPGLRQASGLFKLQQKGNFLVYPLGYAEGNHCARTETGRNKINHFFVTLHCWLGYRSFDFIAKTKEMQKRLLNIAKILALTRLAPS